MGLILLSDPISGAAPQQIDIWNIRLFHLSPTEKQLTSYPKSVLLTLGSEDVSTRALGALVVARGALVGRSEDGGDWIFFGTGKS